MIKYIKLDWFKLVQGIMDAIVLEEEPKQSDVYVEVINSCDKQPATVDEFIRKTACWESRAFDIYLMIAIYYKLTKKKTIFDYRAPGSSDK